MDSKLQPVLLYGFSKSRLYEPLGTAIFFRNRFCPVSWILVFLPVHFYGYSLGHGMGQRNFGENRPNFLTA